LGEGDNRCQKGCQGTLGKTLGNIIKVAPKKKHDGLFAKDDGGIGKDIWGH